ncbi:UTP-glucose-1-phosphate uridylyltransferase [Bartonella callosciuri]|uniref:UTP-glucose-1-phosphate uridylyltransferase n=1 Tax=Bartonella callosciuri TaxID=686223 RepID=A0A840NL27_9HYPH|nr:UTP-glucose-1-phosphate uridylyltransferase [Bartonella callosciuri]
MQSEIFNILSNQKRGADNEIQLTDAMERLSNEQDFFGFQLKGLTFDCGSKAGFIEANIAFFLARSDMRNHVLLY